MPKRPTDMLHAFRQNLQRELKARNLDMQGASVKAALGKTFVRDVLTRERDPGLSYMWKLAKAHDLSIDHLLELSPGPAQAGTQSAIKVRGEVGAGSYHSVDADGDQDDFGQLDSLLPADPAYPADAQYDLVVRGNSINRFARNGERLRVVDIGKTGLEAFDDDMVVVERTKDQGQLVQTTAKRVRRRGPMIELWPDSDDPRWQEPERIDTRKPQYGVEIRIVAIVLYAYNPARTRRR